VIFDTKSSTLPTELCTSVLISLILVFDSPVLIKLDNVVVRLSSDSVIGETIEGLNTSTIVPNQDYLTSYMTLCEAYKTMVSAMGVENAIPRMCQLLLI
jgi:hypothetical protein